MHDLDMNILPNTLIFIWIYCHSDTPKHVTWFIFLEPLANAGDSPNNYALVCAYFAVYVNTPTHTHAQNMLHNLGICI